MRAVKVPLMPLARRKRAARSADLRIVSQYLANLVAVPTGLYRIGQLGCDERRRRSGHQQSEQRHGDPGNSHDGRGELQLVLRSRVRGPPSQFASSTNIWYRFGMAKKNTSIALGAPFVDFALRKVASGEFGSTSEVVREAMRRFVAEDEQVEALRRLIREGEESGPTQPFDFDEFVAEMRTRNKDAA